MSYITAGEAARRWGVTTRLVQRYCKQGRIVGAEKLGGSWRIPEGAVKPDDPRRGEHASAPQTPSPRPTFSFQCLMPLMGTAYAPGTAKAFVASLAEGTRASVAQAVLVILKMIRTKPFKVIEAIDLFGAVVGVERLQKIAPCKKARAMKNAQFDNAARQVHGLSEQFVMRQKAGQRPPLHIGGPAPQHVGKRTTPCAENGFQPHVQLGVSFGIIERVRHASTFRG